MFLLNRLPWILRRVFVKLLLIFPCLHQTMLLLCSRPKREANIQQQFKPRARKQKFLLTFFFQRVKVARFLMRGQFPLSVSLFFFKIYILCRQFLDLAKKVEDEAKHFSLLIQSYGMNKSLPMPTLLPGDLKRCFSICQKDIFSISVYILLCSTATLTLKFTNEVYNEVCMKCTTEVK